MNFPRMRKILSAPGLLNIVRGHFEAIPEQGGLRDYAFMEGYYLLDLDGTGIFSSGTIHCERCGEKHKRNGETEYYHQLLQPAIVHPDKSVVLPLCPEPITRADGKKKNDCDLC